MKTITIIIPFDPEEIKHDLRQRGSEYNITIPICENKNQMELSMQSSSEGTIIPKVVRDQILMLGAYNLAQALRDCGYAVSKIDKE